MIKKIAWNWEYLEEGIITGTRRAKVIGGWVVHTFAHADKKRIAEAMVFIPDRDHEWTIVKPFNPAEEAKKYIAQSSDFEVK